MLGGINMKKILLLMAIFLICVNSQMVFADCRTGYACLLKDVKEQDSVIKTMQQDLINRYYKLKLTEPTLKSGDYMLTYMDLFPFSPRYY